MKLSLITDDVALAVEAEQAGIDRIMIDLERDGKAERQAGRGLFLSSHRIESVAPVEGALVRTPLVVRIWYELPTPVDPPGRARKAV